MHAEFYVLNRREETERIEKIQIKLQIQEMHYPLLVSSSSYLHTPIAICERYFPT